MTPFEALYGFKPKQICFPADCRSKNASVEDFQVKREAMNIILQESIHLAQQIYKKYADMKRTEVVLQVGDWVFLKLRPYRQVFVAIKKHLKLAHNLVLERVGASCLQAPTTPR